MKKIILCFFLICGIVSTSSAQEITYAFGLKGGINYTMGGQITGESSGVGYWDETAEAQGKIGYHGGAFFQLNLGRFFARPELVYTAIETEYEFPEENSIHSVQKFDIPFLIGYNIYGPIDVYAGPLYSNILDSNIMADDNGDPINVVVQNSPINFQAGAKLEFRRFGIDFRYERTLSPAEPHGLDFRNSTYGVNRATFDDPRINQVIVSVTFKLGGSGLNEGGGRRRGACY